MKHTKGEWKMTIDGEANFYGILNNNNWLMRIQQNGELLEEEQLSNAKLIAAAPELLEVLQIAKKYLENEGTVLEMIDKAIKKATE